MFKKTVFYIVAFFFLYILGPVAFSIKFIPHPIKAVFLFYLLNIIIAAALLKRNFNKIYALDYKIQSLQEKFNISSDEISKLRLSSDSLKEKIERYKSLRLIIERINHDLDLDSVADTFTQIAFSTISNKKGVCALYLVDPQSQKLALFKTKKENKELVIRAKEGDIFDYWVSRHSSPLLIEDIRKDFRFDLDKLKNEDEHRVGSLISVPLKNEDKFLGLLRLDSPEAHLFSQDDLRFLLTLSDLGAVAIENSQFFKYTQDLAIHDGLTSLYTKGYFLQRLKDEAARALRKKSNFSLLMLDIDFFKDYNDKYGHTAGDIVLKKLSLRLLEELADFGPVVSRFGGEEFCVILLEVDKKKASHIADELRQAVAGEKIILRRQETNITVSIGVASFPADAISEDELIQKADKAMYEAKQKGRNRVCST